MSNVDWGNAGMGVGAFDPAASARRTGLRPDQTAVAFVDLLLQGDLRPQACALDQATARRPATADALREASPAGPAHPRLSARLRRDPPCNRLDVNS